MEAARYIFSGMQVLIDETWRKDLAVVVDNGLIAAIIPTSMIKHHLPAEQQKFPHDFHLIPGLIDLHIHGVQGHDVMDANEEALTSISCALAKEGVTGFLATTMTSDHKQLETVLKAVSAMSGYKDGAAILGIHLEGPFISQEKKGAQHGKYVQLPDNNLIRHWQNIANGMIKVVTLAPELPQALSLIETLGQLGIIAAAGHTNATYAETKAAIEAGCSQATHLFNAMRNLHQREPGAVTALLLADNVMAELIADGLHLHPAVVELALRLKGKEKLLLVTDAIRAKCCPDGQYDLGGQTVYLHAEKAVLADGTLAGSTLCMINALKNMVQFTACSLADAVMMATINPARVLGLAEHKGSIEVGKDADLVVLNAALEVVLTMRGGRIVSKVPSFRHFMNGA